MKQSLLKRLLWVISAVLLVAFSIGQILGFFIIKEWFLNEQLKELTPIMENIASETRIKNGTIKIKNEERLIIKAYDLDNNEIPIDDNNIKKNRFFTDEEIKEDLQPYIDIVFKEGKVTTIESLNHIVEKSIIIGLPIKDNNRVVGTIFTVKLASDFSVIVNSFYVVFFICSLLSTLVIIILIYYFTRKLIKPLLEMVNVSNSMALGNFSARAECDGYGEIKILSNSLNNLAQRLSDNDESARRLEQTRRDYIANVSHELRTPISSIRAISETLCDDLELDEDKKKRYYLIVLRESKRLQKLINDMLELSRLQSGEMAILKEVVSGKKIMTEIEEYFEVFAEDMDAEFILTEDVLNIPDFYSNESRIMQVMFILIDNGFKFTKKDGYVKVNGSWNDEIIKISIENNGDPIDSEDAEFIFERFYKGDKSHNEKGSGLGLSLAKEIMNNLGEDIYIDESREDVTSFVFTLHRYNN